MSNKITCLQITDLHLFADSDSTLLGTATYDSLVRVIEDVKKKSLNPDFLILSGDLSQDNSLQSYQQVLELFKTFTCPIYYIPGNHDDLPTMAQCFKHSFLRHEKIRHQGNWTFIFLNSHLPNQVHGFLTATELGFLENSLKESKQNVMIFIHHHVIDCGTTWLHDLGLHNASEFLAVIDAHPSVKAVVSGHIHQDFDRIQDHIRYLATPSTCIQFKPNQDRFTLDSENPGYRLLVCYDDGKIETEVHRISDYHPSIDPHAQGYE